MIKILFICHGNICRSPMAEFVMKYLVRQVELDKDYKIASAATSWEEIGNPIYPPARAKLREHGVPFSQDKRAQQLNEKFYEQFDWLICMDSENVYNTRQFFGGDPEQKIHLLLDYTDVPGREVADPWYSGNFEAAWQDIYDGCLGLLCYLQGWEPPEDPESKPAPKTRAKRLSRWTRYSVKQKNNN